MPICDTKIPCEACKHYKYDDDNGRMACFAKPNERNEVYSEPKTDRRTNPKHWVIIAEWCVDYENGHEIMGVYHSKEEAITEFNNRVNSDEKIIADERGYEIYEDTDICFDAGEEGEYVSDHVYIAIHEVN